MGLRPLVDAKCKQCIYDNCAPGYWRQQVAACTVQTCPLWPVRPRSKGEKARSGPKSSQIDAAADATQAASILD
jgi:hypothetical protein